MGFWNILGKGGKSPDDPHRGKRQFELNVSLLGEPAEGAGVAFLSQLDSAAIAASSRVLESSLDNMPGGPLPRTKVIISEDRQSATQYYVLHDVDNTATMSTAKREFQHFLQEELEKYRHLLPPGVEFRCSAQEVGMPRREGGASRAGDGKGSARR